MTATDNSNADFSPILPLAEKLAAKVKQEKKREELRQKPWISVAMQALKDFLNLCE